MILLKLSLGGVGTWNLKNHTIMAGVNKVILVGRLGKDPEVRNLENGAVVANFTLATSESYKDKTTGDKKEVTEWHNIVLWRVLAEISQKYLHKGDMVYVEGKLRTRSWEKEGVTRYTTEVIADNMTMLSTKGSGGGSGSSYSPAETSAADSFRANAGSGSDTSTDDLPF